MKKVQLFHKIQKKDRSSHKNEREIRLETCGIGHIFFMQWYL